MGKVVEAAKEEDKKVLLVRQNKAKILKVFIGQHCAVLFRKLLKWS